MHSTCFWKLLELILKKFFSFTELKLHKNAKIGAFCSLIVHYLSKIDFSDILIDK